MTGAPRLRAPSARSMARQLEGRGVVLVTLAAFAGAFIVYEGGLFIVAATLLGGTEDFMPAIVAYILEINAVAFLGLMVLQWVGGAIGLSSKQPFRQLAGARHA